MGTEFVTSYMNWRELTKFLKPGDLIEFRRGNLSGIGGSVYQHWAVYVGVFQGVHQVIHYSNEDMNDMRRRAAQLCGEVVAQSFCGNIMEVSGNVEVQWELLEFVASGCPCRKNNAWDEVDTPRPRSEIVRVAKSKVGEGGYNLATNNCEHFAHFCRYGKKRSGQVERTGTTLGGMAAGIGAAVVLGGLYWWLQGGDEEESEDQATDDSAQNNRDNRTVKRSS